MPSQTEAVQLLLHAVTHADCTEADDFGWRAVRLTDNGHDRVTAIPFCSKCVMCQMRSMLLLITFIVCKPELASSSQVSHVIGNVDGQRDGQPLSPALQHVAVHDEDSFRSHLQYAHQRIKQLRPAWRRQQVAAAEMTESAATDVASAVVMEKAGAAAAAAADDDLTLVLMCHSIAGGATPKLLRNLVCECWGLASLKQCVIPWPGADSFHSGSAEQPKLQYMSQVSQSSGFDSDLQLYSR